MARITGKNGSVYLSGSKIGDTYHWEFEDMLGVDDATIKGETYRRYVATVGEGRIRAQRYVQTVASFTDTVQSQIASGLPVDFILWGIDGTSLQIVGQGYLTRGHVIAGREGMVTDELEITVDGTPTTVA